MEDRIYPSQIRQLYIDYTDYGRNQVTEFKRLADTLTVTEKELKKAFSSERYYRKFWKKYFGIDIGEPPYRKG